MSKCNESRSPKFAIANYAITDLHHYCFIGELEKVKMLLKRNKCDINLPDNVGRTPLHFAAGKNQVDVASFLLDLGANPDHIDDKGRTAKDVAIEKKSKDVEYMLCKYSTNIINIDF